MSENILPDYTFLPWLRKGIANKIDEEETNGAGGGNLERAKIDVKLKITGTNGGASDTLTFSKEVSLIGPGDIVGVSNTAIVKNDPQDKTINFEPNYLASIQFYDEDFVWRYSPATANPNGQLRPWLFLLVLKESEFNLEDPTNGILPSINIPDGSTASFLPNYQEIAAWAHVQANDKLADVETDELSVAIDKLEENVASNPNLATCRILSPRKLEQDTKYHAFLVPSYEVGRLAGLGVKYEEFDPKIAVQLASWGTTHNPEHEPNRWPVYHTWSFETGEGGDFEHLVRLLKPRILDNQVGRRPMDIQDPGFGLNYQVDLVEEGEPIVKTTLSLEGALKIPESSGEAYPYPDAEDDVDGFDPVTQINFREQLQDLVNLDEDLKLEGDFSLTDNYYGDELNLIGDANVNDDPIIAPPLYGRWHFLANRAKIDNIEGTGGTANWFHELNLDPRHRAIAAVGTEVVQQDQDFLMDEAWEQLGDVIEANKKVLWAQLATETANALYKKHVKSQPNEKALALTGKMKRRIKNTVSGKTFYQEEKEARLPLAVEDKSFRRIARPIGPFMKKLDPEQKINKSDLGQELVSRLDNGFATAAVAKSEPIFPGSLQQPTSVSLLDLGVNNAAPHSPAFRLGAIGIDPDNTGGLETADYKDALALFITYFDGTNWVLPEPKLPFDILKATTIKEEIRPKKTMVSRIYKTILFDELEGTPERIVPAMAHPVFRQPMYEAVRDLDTQLLIPNLNLVPMNTISLLETNQKFIESYMVGLNHEMGRELLWREYPTDQRGTYFQQFWNVSDSINTEGFTSAELEEDRYDISKIHNWDKTTNLGTHNTGEVPAKPVLLIRGDLLRKYPNAVIYAIQAEWQVLEGVKQYNLPRRPKTDTEVYPIFNATIDPDITFFGFDLTIEDARGADPAALQELIDTDGNIGDADDSPGYFFVLKERPGEARFALDVAPEEPETFASWNDLHWGRLSSTETIGLGDLLELSPSDPTWDGNMNAAEMASVLYQNPVMVCVHAREMLQEAE